MRYPTPDKPSKLAPPKTKLVLPDRPHTCSYDRLYVELVRDHGPQFVATRHRWNRFIDTEREADGLRMGTVSVEDIIHRGLSARAAQSCPKATMIVQ